MKKILLFSSFLALVLTSQGISKQKAESISWGEYFRPSLKGAGVGFLAGGIIGAAASSSAGNGEFAGLATSIGFAIYGTIVGSFVGTGFVAQNNFFTPLAIMTVQLTSAIFLIKNDRTDIAFYLGLSSIFITPTLAKLLDKIQTNPPIRPKLNNRNMTLVPVVAPIRNTYGLSFNIRF